LDSAHKHQFSHGNLKKQKYYQAAGNKTVSKVFVALEGRFEQKRFPKG